VPGLVLISAHYLFQIKKNKQAEHEAQIAPATACLLAQLELPGAGLIVYNTK